jgi:L-lysine 6-transaminase
MLADGYDLVFDFEKSHGSWVHDRRTGREYLDFLTSSDRNPIGYNHPKMKDPEFLRVLARVAQLKPALPDIYSVVVRAGGRHVRPGWRSLPTCRYAFFIEGGALGGRERAEGRLRLEGPPQQGQGIPGEKGTQIIHFREAFHGRSGYTLSLTNTDPVKTDYFPKFPWPRIDNPKLRFPSRPRWRRRSRGRGDARSTRSAGLRRQPRRHRRHHHRAHPGRGRRQPLPARVPAGPAAAGPQNECFFIVDEVQTGIGLTGKMWAHEHFGITPGRPRLRQEDAGVRLPGGPRVDEEPRQRLQGPSRINSTWGGGTHRHGALRRYLEVIHEDRLVDNARVVGEHLLRGLEALQRELAGLMTNARGRGLMIAFDLPTPAQRDRATRRSWPAACCS